MVRPGGRGAGRIPKQSPPPDYMAAMMQQFEMNHQLIVEIMAQLPNQNQYA